jgi:hypothetical protein
LPYLNFFKQLIIITWAIFLEVLMGRVKYVLFALSIISLFSISQNTAFSEEGFSVSFIKKNFPDHSINLAEYNSQGQMLYSRQELFGANEYYTSVYLLPGEYEDWEPFLIERSQTCFGEYAKPASFLPSGNIIFSHIAKNQNGRCALVIEEFNKAGEKISSLTGPEVKNYRIYAGEPFFSRDGSIAVAIYQEKNSYVALVKDGQLKVLKISKGFTLEKLNENGEILIRSKSHSMILNFSDLSEVRDYNFNVYNYNSKYEAMGDTKKSKSYITTQHGNVFLAHCKFPKGSPWRTLDMIEADDDGNFYGLVYKRRWNSPRAVKLTYKSSSDEKDYFCPIEK